MRTSKSKIAVLSAGGTISMERGSEGLLPRLGAAALLDQVPVLSDFARIEPVDICQVPSVELGFRDVAAIADVARQKVRAGCAGVVLVQGTDMMEETAFLLDLLLDLPNPVVVTGAMRAPDQSGSDGISNLINAVRVASRPEARRLGVLVVMNFEVHAARFVRKLHTSNPAAFASSPGGPLGCVTEGRVELQLRPMRALPTLVWGGVCPRVGVLTVALGASAESVEAALAQRPAGLIVAGAGAGHVPSAWVEPLARAAARIPVVLSSRTGSGEVARNTYGYAGAEIDLLRRGIIHGGFLDPLKARILLALLLSDNAGADAIANAFASC